MPADAGKSTDPPPPRPSPADSPPHYTYFKSWRVEGPRRQDGRRNSRHILTPALLHTRRLEQESGKEERGGRSASDTRRGRTKGGNPKGCEDKLHGSFFLPLVEIPARGKRERDWARTRRPGPVQLNPVQSLPRSCPAASRAVAPSLPRPRTCLQSRTTHLTDCSSAENSDSPTPRYPTWVKHDVKNYTAGSLFRFPFEK